MRYSKYQKDDLYDFLEKWLDDNCVYELLEVLKDILEYREI